MATIQAKVDMVPKPALSVFATALRRERARFKFSRHELADQCGVSVKTYESWETGEAVPDVQRFKRLVGLMRKLAATPPNYSRGTDRATLEDKAVIDIQREALKSKEPEQVPEPEAFHIGLKRIREANGLTMRELADLFGYVSGAVSNWETGRNAPSGENLALLYEVLPDLKAAIDVGAVKAPIVLRQSAGYKATSVAKPQAQLAIVKDEPEAKAAEPEPKPEPKPAPASAPVAMLITKPGDPLADVSNRYAAARRAMLLTSKQYDAALAALDAAREAKEKAQREHDEALAAFDAIAMEPIE